jgi:cytoskeletal protein RodZ
MRKTKTIITLVILLILSAIAIFTAIRLYQLRQKSVTPNVPESKPKAATSSCQVLTFNISTPTPTPVYTLTPTPTPVYTLTPTPTPVNTPTPIITQTPISTQTPNITSTPIPTQTPLIAGAPTPTTETSLPEAGTSWPTGITIGIGIALIIFSFILAF